MSWTTKKVGSNHKNRKIDWFKLKEIVPNTVQEDQFLYVTHKFGYKFNSWLLQYFSLNFSISFFSRVSCIIYLPFNDLGPPLVDHPGHYLSVCPIEHPLCPLWVGVVKTILFRSLLYIYAIRKLAAEHLMQWQQPSLRYFLAPIPLVCPWCMSLSIEPPYTSPWSIRHTFWSLPHLFEGIFILGPPSPAFTAITYSWNFTILHFPIYWPTLEPLSLLGHGQRPKSAFGPLVPTKIMHKIWTYGSNGK